MTGSGSTLFAVYRSDRDRDDAAMMLGRKYGIVTAARTVAAPPNAVTANANG
jgi:4-diphosphocytidyl-2C-methyl-D-erythritol kinase